MSTTYIPLKPISFAQLFDGRLEPFGIREHVHPKDTTKNERCLTDEESFLWVYRSRDGAVGGFTRWRHNGMPIGILEAISRVFRTRIISEHEAEMSATCWAVHYAVSNRGDYCLKILKDVYGKPNGIPRGSIEETHAKIAKKLIAADPALAQPGQKDDLLRKIDAVFFGEPLRTPTKHKCTPSHA